MENLTENDKELQEGEVEFIPEGSSFTEQLLRTCILGYQEAYNKNSDSHDVQYTLTITTHKVATPDGNKDIAYLRIDRGTRPKDSDNEWEPQLIHQEMYVFKNIKERVNPKARWKEQLFVNALARLTAAGLEYAELLQRISQTEKNQKAVQEDQKIVVTNQMPTPLTKEDEDYKKWLQAERTKEGL